MKESDLLDAVIDAARLGGWMVAHFRAGMMASGRWVTPMQGDVGFPDCVLCHPVKGVIFAELKSEKGRMRPEQENWIKALVRAGAEVYVWRPSDMDQIIERLVHS